MKGTVGSGVWNSGTPCSAASASSASGSRLPAVSTMAGGSKDSRRPNASAACSGESHIR